MALKTEQRSIDGLAFDVTQLPAMRSLRLMHALTAALGPGLLRVLAAGGDAKLSFASMDVASLGPGLESALQRLTADEMERLIRELLDNAYVTREGKRVPLMPVFDVEMAGKHGVIFKLVAFALEVNYGDFFGALLASVKREGADVPSVLKGT